jgi:hypothetical protein
MYPTPNQKQSILSGKSQSTPEYPNFWKREEYQKSIDGMKKYSAKKNPNDCPNTLYGTTQ